MLIRPYHQGPILAGATHTLTTVTGGQGDRKKSLLADYALVTAPPHEATRLFNASAGFAAILWGNSGFFMQNRSEIDIMETASLLLTVK